MKSTTIYVAALILAVGCGNAELAAPPEATAGKVSGTVTLLGSAGSPAPTGQVTLYASVEDFEQRKAAYAGSLSTTAPSVRTYAFTVAYVQPGNYYLRACFSFGCGEYRDGQTGALLQVGVRAGETTRVAIAF